MFILYLFIHAQKSGGELNLVFTQSWRGCLCACARFKCVRGKLLTQRSTVTPTIPSVLYARLVPSGSPYIESWYVRLMRLHVLVVMHRRTLCENVDSAKIKVPFYTTDIDILHWHRCIVSSYIASIYRSISMNRYTPNIYIKYKYVKNKTFYLNNTLYNI